MFYHYRCPSCANIYAFENDEPDERPKCVKCRRNCLTSGKGAKRLRPRAILMTAAAIERAVRPQRASVKAGREAAFKKHREARALDKQIGTIAVPDDPEDEAYLPLPRTFNIAMRFSPGCYAASPGRVVDATYTMRNHWSTIGGAAGRLALNGVMGRYLNGRGSVTASSVQGTRPFTHATKFQSSEWCHLLADSLGGPSTADNVVAASFSANTYMAAMEMMLKGQSTLQIKVEVDCSGDRCAEYIRYRIRHPNHAARFERIIDARAANFSATDATKVQGDLSAWMRSVGLVPTLSF